MGLPVDNVFQAAGFGIKRKRVIIIFYNKRFHAIFLWTSLVERGSRGNDQFRCVEHGNFGWIHLIPV